MRDSYIEFLSRMGLTKHDFFEFGLNETIYAKEELVSQCWSDLKMRIETNQVVYIRGFGRDSNGTHLFQALYSRVLNNHHVVKDSTNNAEPTKLIKQLTGYSKTRSKQHEVLRNYQISHVFGRTKNVYAFTAPWNIVYVPKVIDPFTGHEAKGEMVDEYTELFQKSVYDRFGSYIDEFNHIMTNPVFLASLDQYIDELRSSNDVTESIISKMSKAVSEEFAPIEI
ncbi:hypothetical protein [Vibrio parahaemolyticus]|uniref:hypothetical protein n=1 Tax=Vibrio parahaemolyticus TaxID=670 RepID=UPI0019D18A96|nr:hypothetical protein [Vibrio parahaemolyticus]EJS4061539.1 hypothetical protein [Vibrio parahaemolyticus]